MLKYLDKQLKDFESEFKIIDDKTIDTSCNLYRPDRRYDCGTHQVIVECDEHQHQERACVCEQTRMINISQSFGMPTYFIRWNPDDYQPFSDKKNPDNIKKRYETLGTFIKNIQENKIELPKCFVGAFYMYYNEFDDVSKESWKILLELEKDEVIEHIRS